MNNYTLTILVKDDLSEKDRKEVLESVTKQFGKVEKEDMWGSRPLVYDIAHQNKAYFAHFEFESDPSTISALDRNLKLNEDILRYLLLKKD